MPRLFFTISSIPDVEYKHLARGYQDYIKVRSARPSLLRKVVSSILRRFRRTKTPKTESFAANYLEHPILNPEFLRLCVEVAEFLQKGYVVGQGNGEDVFHPLSVISLEQSVSVNREIFAMWFIQIRPHSYSADIPDVPVLALLLRLMRITGDSSYSELLNRLALWLSFIVYAKYYCLEIVVMEPNSAQVHILNVNFLSKYTANLNL